MKMFKMLLPVIMATAIFSHVAADDNLPMITDGVMDLEQYLFGDVDSNGQTILHRLAANCDNDDFTVRFKPFAFVDGLEQSEDVKTLQLKMALYDALPIEIGQAVVVMKLNNFVQKKDNNGQTALDIARKRNALNPHQRCVSCVELLEIFEKLNKDLNK